MYVRLMRSDLQINELPREAKWDKPVLGLASLFALLSASCCVLPIGLTVLGLGGSWLTFLGPFVAYRTVILIAVGGVLVLAWWRLLRRRNRCTSRRTGIVLLTSTCTALFAVALTAPWWEQAVAQTMWTYWTER